MVFPRNCTEGPPELCLPALNPLLLEYSNLLKINKMAKYKTDQLGLFKAPARDKLPEKKKLVNKFMVYHENAGFYIVLNDPQVEGYYAFKIAADFRETWDQVQEMRQFKAIEEVELTDKILNNFDFFGHFGNLPRRELTLYKIL